MKLEYQNLKTFKSYVIHILVMLILLSTSLNEIYQLYYFI